MKELTSWTDEQFRQMRAEMDRLFRDFLSDYAGPAFELPGGEAPCIEMSEEEALVVIRMAFPGLDPADLEIAVSPEMVIIEVVRREKLGKGVREVQRSRSCSQRIKLPCRVVPEGAEAICLDHRLEIRLPKCRPAVFRKISLRRSGK